jgi:hypothetical protein
MVSQGLFVTRFLATPKILTQHDTKRVHFVLDTKVFHTLFCQS